MIKSSSKPGFTIVELLIVIVVIGILAAITIVAYNGIQTRAKVANRLSDLKSLNNAILLYQGDIGTYPSTGGGWTGLGQQADYLPNIVPAYISKLPPQLTGPVPANGTAHTTPGYLPAYAYISDGANYKLMAHNDELCGQVQAQQPAMIDPIRTCWAYGYWSSGASNW